jgi:hypothetical protein
VFFARIFDIRADRSGVVLSSRGFVGLRLMAGNHLTATMVTQKKP